MWRRSTSLSGRPGSNCPDSTGLAVAPTVLEKSPAKRSRSVSVSPSASTTACSRKFSSWRTLPGHGSIVMRSSVDDATFVIGLP